MRKKTVSGMALALLLVGALFLTFGMEQVAGQSHDIAITNVTCSKTVVGQGYNVDITVVVENQGDFSEDLGVNAYYGSEILTYEQWETFWASCGDVDRDGYVGSADHQVFNGAYGTVCGDPLYNPDCDFNQDCSVDTTDLMIILWGSGKDIWTFFNIQGGHIGFQYVLDLLPADSTTLVFTWSTDTPYGNYTSSARSIPWPGETNMTNNFYHDGWVVVTISGDIDGDYYVGSEDAGILNGAYGTSEGDPLYVPEADIDSDGYIGSADAGILNGNYGKTAT